LQQHVGDGVGEWDSDRIAQLVTNLVSNALDYSPTDSAVRVRSDGAADEVVFTVENGGDPIPSDLLPEIFEPMRRGSPKASSGDGGVGLGLYIVREVVAAHGGTVTVRSTAAEGTRFEIRLPRRPPVASPDDDVGHPTP
jgi:signal transduction histidine kinase